MDAVWFLRTGVAIVLAGLLDLVIIREAGKDKLIRILCLAAGPSTACLSLLSAFKKLERNMAHEESR